MANNDVSYRNELNDKKYDIGDIIFWVDPYTHKWDWGVVEDHYCDGYGIGLYELVDTRTIEGIPIKDYPYMQKRRKLPKGWTWDTSLFEVEHDTTKEKEVADYFNNHNGAALYDKEVLLNAIANGVYVKPSSQMSNYYPTSDVSKDGWVIKLEQGHNNNRTDYACVQSCYCCDTYEEAQAIIQAYNDELHRQAELSDYDWSVEQIDKTLNRVTWLDDDYKKHCREWLLEQKDVEDIVVRPSSSGIEWKYDKNKKWMTIV